MADLSDITTLLAGLATTAIYPNGTTQPSVAGMDCRIMEGWPIPDQLEADMAGMMMTGVNPPALVSRPGGPVLNVSVFPMPGTGIRVYQVLDETYVITPPAYGLVLTLVGNVLTVAGQPGDGEYITVELNRADDYSRTGLTTAVLLAALLADIQVKYPSATGTSTSITFPSNFQLVVRQGTKATLGKVTWRQQHEVMVTVWANNQANRKVLANAVDNYIKTKIKVALPDTSQAIIRYSRTNTSDEQQAQTVYRRDLIYAVEYATVEQFPGYVVTSITTSHVNAIDNSVVNSIS